jgi:hypothetical protein
MNPALLARDLQAALTALPGGVVVSFGATTIQGNLHTRPKLFEDGSGRIQSTGNLVELRIVKGALPGVVQGSVLTTAPLPPYPGTPETWEVRDLQDEADGATLLALAKA